MKKYLLLIFFCSQLYALKILHLSCHQGCITEFERVGNELGLEVTSWYILNSSIFHQLTGSTQPTYDILNMTHERAEKIWHRISSQVNQFDAIITSDTAPLSRIFLQNNCRKPIIIWVCNRFDYHHEISANNFPDQEYYQLIREAMLKPNVFIASYTPYEYKYAHTKNVDIGTLVIKPIGSLPGTLTHSNFPESVDKSSTIFISQTGPAPLAPMQQKCLKYIQKECTSRGIRTIFGKYNGADDLTDIKGVLHFPYQASNLFLFENIQRGIVHFVPSKKFLAMAAQSDNPDMPCKDTRYWLASFDDTEWYLPENEKLFVYFDSWDDLKEKINDLDYEAQRAEILILAQQHRTTMLNRWKKIINQITSLIS